MSPTTQRRFLLGEAEMPTHYYNINADLPVPLPPPLNPATREPVGPDALAPLFPLELILQEVSTERFIEIPAPVREVYATYRPSPLVRAVSLERSLDTPAHIYFKYEGVSPAGSHKPNTAIPQAFYNREAGVTKLATETGDGPDVVIGCAGGGSNFSGIAFPFLRERLAGRSSTRFLAVEPASCPSLTK